MIKCICYVGVRVSLNLMSPYSLWASGLKLKNQAWQQPSLLTKPSRWPGFIHSQVFFTVHISNFCTHPAVALLFLHFWVRLTVLLGEECKASALNRVKMLDLQPLLQLLSQGPRLLAMLNYCNSFLINTFLQCLPKAATRRIPFKYETNPNKIIFILLFRTAQYVSILYITKYPDATQYHKNQYITHIPPLPLVGLQLSSHSTLVVLMFLMILTWSRSKSTLAIYIDCSLTRKLISGGHIALSTPPPCLLSKEISITPSMDKVKNTFSPFSQTWPWVFILTLFPWQLDKGRRVSLLPSNSTLGVEKPWSIYRSIWIGSLSVSYKYVASAHLSKLLYSDSS